MRSNNFMKPIINFGCIGSDVIRIITFATPFGLMVVESTDLRRIRKPLVSFRGRSIVSVTIIFLGTLMELTYR